MSKLHFIPDVDPQAPKLGITLYELASRFEGLREIPGATRNHPAILAALQLDDDWPEDDETPWCSAAMNALAWMLGLPRPEKRALAARSWLTVGRPVRLFGDARIGWDVVILWRGSPEGTAGHVALFAGWSPDRRQVRMLGGNQGDEFNVSEYGADRIIGIRRLFEG